MGHCEKHFDKTDEELVVRLMSEWKLACSCITNMPAIDIDSLHEGENLLTFDEIVGFGYNRFFEKIYSKTIMIIVEEGEIVTVYAVISGRSSEKFDFSSFDARKYAGEDFNLSLWGVFVKAIADGFSARYVWRTKKNHYVKVFTEEGTYRVSKDLEWKLQTEEQYICTKTPMQIALERAGWL